MLRTFFDRIDSTGVAGGSGEAGIFQPTFDFQRLYNNGSAGTLSDDEEESSSGEESSSEEENGQTTVPPTTTTLPSSVPITSRRRATYRRPNNQRRYVTDPFNELFPHDLPAPALGRRGGIFNFNLPIGQPLENVKVPLKISVVEQMPLLSFDSSIHKDPDKTCVVCFEEMKDGEQVRYTDLCCKKCVHKKCAYQWWDVQHTCPVCGKNLHTLNDEKVNTNASANLSDNISDMDYLEEID